ncbi:MAG: AAA family ATPase [Ignavibacteria bacterium]|nr:MAG: AAA family ATPase [Ignavibacteria bacterium]
MGQYVGETAQKAGKVIDEAMGGVLFIDEAYTLVKKGGGGQDFGQEAIDILLKRMEDDRGKFVVIAAGYTEEMETFLTSNPGLKSRFTRTFEFEDYTPEELMQIFEMLMENEEYSITDDAKEFLLKEFTRMYRNRDKNFGNARLVRILFEEAKLELSKRFTQLPKEEQTTEAMTTIILDDVKNIVAEKGHKEAKISIDEEQLKSALDKLNGLIGLERARKEIEDLVKLARYYAEEGEDLKSKFCNHYLFLGNPGTGKTTVARIFGQIFSALGILPKGHLVEVDRQGLVANFVGQTAQKTSEAIDKALGGTLFIDEAYTLATSGGSNDFGKEAIDTLLKRMEDDRGKFIVIAAGYTDEMKAFIESNPGIQSRFTKTIHFDDYTPDHLLQITEKAFAAEDIKIPSEIKKALYKYYTELYRNRDKNFGNARIVRNIVEAAKQKRLIRLAGLSQEERSKEENASLHIEDFDVLEKKEPKAERYEISTDPEGIKKVMDELNSLTGLKSVKEGVEKLINGLKVAKLRKERGLSVIEKPLHAVFLGNPGTGKTTVARLMSKVYKELGLLEKGHLVEVDRADLVAGYQGQTATKTDEVIKKALGGTLFIDEAYTLARGGNDFGQEAIDTLLKRMEDHKGEFVCIVAGYTNEMNAFLASNPGLNSRFPNKFVFEDYSPRELLDIAWNIAEKNGYVLDEGALQALLEIFEELYQNRDKNFGNARTARNILYAAIANQEERLALGTDLSKEELMTITYEDVSKVDTHIGLS